MSPVIEASGLVKRFGKTTALNGLDLTVEPGVILAVLGPNGAGKTTFVRAVATLIMLDGGQLRVAGHDVRKDPRAVRRVIGLAGQYAAVEPAMTGRENLEMVARLFGQRRAEARANSDRVLSQIELQDAGDKLVRTYSGGMRRRLDLGASLVGAPRLLLLDEPTTGLDPRSRIELWDSIRALADQGTDVLLTTQYLDEADHLAGRVVIIDHGRLIADGTPIELKQRSGSSTIEVYVSEHGDPAQVAAILAKLDTKEPRIDEATRTGGARRISTRVPDTPAELAACLQALGTVGVAAEDVAIRPATLDEVFLSLTGHRAEDDHQRGPGGRIPPGRGGGREAAA
jgi:ABC-2 type transport system ATP-binding protein